MAGCAWRISSLDWYKGKFWKIYHPQLWFEVRCFLKPIHLECQNKPQIKPNGLRSWGLSDSNVSSSTVPELVWRRIWGLCSGPKLASKISFFAGTCPFSPRRARKSSSIHRVSKDDELVQCFCNIQSVLWPLKIVLSATNIQNIDITWHHLKKTVAWAWHSLAFNIKASAKPDLSMFHVEVKWTKDEKLWQHYDNYTK